jgi:hypothetical protein
VWSLAEDDPDVIRWSEAFPAARQAEEHTEDRMKPDELAGVLTTLADRRRLKLLLEVYRRRGEPPSGAVPFADLCAAAGLTRQQAVNHLAALHKIELIWADHAAWDRRRFQLTGGPLRGLVVELCRLLEGLGNVLAAKGERPEREEKGATEP